MSCIFGCEGFADIESKCDACQAPFLEYVRSGLETQWSCDIDYSQSAAELRQAFLYQNDVRARLGIALLTDEDLAYGLGKVPA